MSRRFQLKTMINMPKIITKRKVYNKLILSLNNMCDRNSLDADDFFGDCVVDTGFKEQT